MSLLLLPFLSLLYYLVTFRTRTKLKMRSFAPLFGFLALQAGHVIANSYTLHHRIGSGQWVKRGVIRSKEGESVANGFDTVYQDLSGNSEPWKALPEYESTARSLYQLALTPEGTNTVDDSSPITFARTCHLASNSDESFTIHTDRDGKQILSLGYDLTGFDVSQLDADGCPKVATNQVPAAKQVIVKMNKPQEPLTVLPPAPPPTKPDGSPLAPGEEPPKEQSFVRKYWYYILPVVLMMLIPTEIADANNDEAENGDGGGGSGSGARLKSTRAGGPAPVGAAAGGRRR